MTTNMPNVGGLSNPNSSTSIVGQGGGTNGTATTTNPSINMPSTTKTNNSVPVPDSTITSNANQQVVEAPALAVQPTATAAPAASGATPVTSTANATANQKLPDMLAQSKDAQTMNSVLKDMGIDEYEPRVINQLLEFSYRYITNLLEDAKAFSAYANKKTIESDDIKLAIKSKVDYSFTTTPPRDLLMEISKAKNKNPLPPIKYHTGIRLPPDRFCLHSQNYALKTQEMTEHQRHHHHLQKAQEAHAQQQRQQEQQLNEKIYQAQRAQQQQQQQQQHQVLAQQQMQTAAQANNKNKRQRDDEDDYDI